MASILSKRKRRIPETKDRDIIMRLSFATHKLYLFIVKFIIIKKIQNINNLLE